MMLLMLFLKERPLKLLCSRAVISVYLLVAVWYSRRFKHIKVTDCLATTTSAWQQNMECTGWPHANNCNCDCCALVHFLCFHQMPDSPHIKSKQRRGITNGIRAPWHLGEPQREGREMQTAMSKITKIAPRFDAARIRRQSFLQKRR